MTTELNCPSGDALPRASADRLQFLLLATPAIIYALRASGDFAVTFISPNVQITLGFSPEEFLKDPDFWASRVHPDDLSAAMAMLAQLKTTDRIIREYRFRHGDGSYRWLQDETKLTRDALGQPQEFIGSWLDITERKAAELEREQERQLLRILIDHIPDMIYVRDMTNRFLIANQAFARHMGVATTTALLGRTDADFYPAQVAERYATTDRKVFAGHELVNYDCLIDFPNGERLNVLNTKIPLKDKAGKVFGMVGVCRDVTEHKRAAEASARLAAIVAFSEDAIISKNLEGIITTWNKGAEKIFGYAASEIVGASILRLVPDDRQAEEARIMNQLKRGESVEHFETLRLTKDGGLLHVSITASPIRDAGGVVIGASKVVRDITERKRAEEQIMVQISALTAAANAIVITNREGKIEWVNPAFTKLTGFSAEEAIGGNPRVLKSGQHPPAFYAALWATVLAGNVWHGELINKRKDGKEYTEEMTVTPVRDADGQIRHFVAIKQDVSERRQLENRMQQAQKMEAIGTLAGGIAHDFNNMLGAMFGYAHLLQEDTAGNLLAQESVEEILKAANRAKELVQQILTFSRQRESSRQVIRLEPIIKEATKFLRSSLPSNLKIETQFAVDAPAVLADPTQIYQVTMNLATNALHAMEDQPGRLTVQLEAIQPDAKLLEAHPNLKPIPYARLTVGDTGHGIDAKTLERIFEPFFTTKPLGKGTGLGLSVVHGIMNSHEGVITVESWVGQGTTFRLYFPAQTQVETAAVDAGPVRHARGRGQRILLLDDETTLTSMLQKMLSRLNYQVATSNRPGEAIRLVRENPAQFDLVITDLMMPEITGLKVASQLRVIRPDLPVILVSGFSEDVNADRLQEAGICERLEKPVAMSVLAEVVQRVLLKEA